MIRRLRGLDESWVLGGRTPHHIVVAERIETHGVLIRVLLHVPEKVMLEEVIVVRILNCPAPAQSKVCA